MRSHRSALTYAAAAIALALWAIATPARRSCRALRSCSSRWASAERPSSPRSKGWGPDKSGENLFLLLGYYNRNKSQELVIPIGPDNRIEPDGPDYGQPTHFYTGRQHGVFAIKVPKDFGNKRLTWSITANGQTSTISFWLNPAYWVNFYKHPANSNEPPVIRLTRDGVDDDGAAAGNRADLSAAVGQRVPLTVWASDVPTWVSPVEEELAALTRAASAARVRRTIRSPSSAVR